VSTGFSDRHALKAYQGKAPVGCYYGRPSPQTRALVADVYREEGLPNLTWQSDDYSDDVPFWTPYPGGTKDEGLLILPYSVGGHSPDLIVCLLDQYDNNDFKFSRGSGWTSASAFSTYLINAYVIIAIKAAEILLTSSTVLISSMKKAKRDRQR